MSTELLIQRTFEAVNYLVEDPVFKNMNIHELAVPYTLLDQNIWDSLTPSTVWILGKEVPLISMHGIDREFILNTNMGKIRGNVYFLLASKEHRDQLKAYAESEEKEEKSNMEAILIRLRNSFFAVASGNLNAPETRIQMAYVAHVKNKHADVPEVAITLAALESAFPGLLDTIEKRVADFGESQ